MLGRGLGAEGSGRSIHEVLNPECPTAIQLRSRLHTGLSLQFTAALKREANGAGQVPAPHRKREERTLFFYGSLPFLEIPKWHW